MTTILEITEDDYEMAVDIARETLRTGGVVIHPTDTAYGIGCDATSEKAVNKVLEIKNITPPRPLSVIAADYAMIEYYCQTGIWEDIILKRYLPGPYTFIMKKRMEIAAASNSDRLGVRIPDNIFCQELAKKFGRPIVSTSANITGHKPPADFGDISKSILEKADLAIDGGPTKYRRPSLVVDLIEGKLMRKGGEEVEVVELPPR